MNKLKVFFVNLISFLSSPAILILAFTAKLLWMPDVYTAATLLATLLFVAFDKNLISRFQLKKMDLATRAETENETTKQTLNALNGQVQKMSERLNVFEAHKTVNAASAPSGVFNLDPNYMR